MLFNKFREDFFSNCIFFDPFLNSCPFNNDRIYGINEAEFNPVRIRLVPIEDIFS